ncbi:MAG: EAL domain-containing protein [Cyanobacteria bacterium P01_F01_bin.13]
MVVDDDPANIEFLTAVLDQHGYEICSALDGTTAINLVEETQPDLVLLDIKMPEMDGYQVCLALKANPLTQAIPVIFLSAMAQAEDKVRAFSVGGIDYIPKPFQAAELLARVKNHITLRAAQLQIQQLNGELEQRVAQRTAQLEEEIGERMRIQEELLHVATHNLLTELPNRTFLSQYITNIFNQNQNQFNDSLVLLLLECDQLQVINNSLGHRAGDQMLVAIAHRLRSCLPFGTLLTHFGEDKFAILLENVPDLNNALHIAKLLQREIELPFYIENQAIHTEVSVGIVQGSSAYAQPQYLLRDANTVISQAQAKGAGTIEVFNSGMHNRARSFFEIQNDLYQALTNQELRLVYQATVSLKTNKIVGAEALVRWHHPQKGIISPGDFIPVAEEIGLIIPIDRYILRQACRQLKHWQNQKLLDDAFKLQVNLSAQQFSQSDFIDYLDDVLTETQINNQNLALEITENALLQQNDLVLTLLNTLKRRQIHVSIDDFGTGYSSLSYLHQLNVENLKIDRSFVSRMVDPQDSLTVVEAIINLAHGLGMTVTAEGVETEKQREYLKILGCEFAQGYFWGRPMAPTKSSPRKKASNSYLILCCCGDGNLNEPFF